MVHKVIALVATLLVSFYAQAATETNTLDALVEKEKVAFLDALNTQTGDELINTLNLFTGSGSSDTEVHQALETKLNELLSYHLSNTKDKVAKDTLASMVRTYASLGVSNSEALLVKIRDSAKSRGVRNRAHGLTRKISWFFQRNQIMNSTEFYRTGQDVMTHRYLALINSGNFAMMRWAAEELDRRDGAEDEVYKTMRSILEEDAFSQKGATHLDTMAWFCRVLKTYDLENSKTLLTSISQSPKADKKLAKYAKI